MLKEPINQTLLYTVIFFGGLLIFKEILKSLADKIKSKQKTSKIKNADKGLNKISKIYNSLPSNLQNDLEKYAEHLERQMISAEYSKK